MLLYLKSNDLIVSKVLASCSLGSREYVNLILRLSGRFGGNEEVWVDKV